MKLIRVLLIDDEPLAQAVVKEYLESFPHFKIVGSCFDGFEGVKAIQELNPDLVFLDIQMPRISGFELLELLENPPAIIFCTAYDDFALKAFDAQAIDYILKPFSADRFKAAIEKFLKSYREPDLINSETKFNGLIESQFTMTNRVVVKTGNNIKIIPASEIHFLEADDDSVSIHTETESFLKNRTLSFFEKTLNPLDFTRVHRSYIIRIAEITRLELYQKDSYLAVLKSGMQIPVSRSGYSKLRDILGI